MHRGGMRNTRAMWFLLLITPIVSGLLIAASSGSLLIVEDIPLPGKPTRFDYQSFDPQTKILYFTHMGDGELMVFDTEAGKLISHIPGFPTATGVLAVPEIGRVFVSVAGNHEVAVVDSKSLKVIARVPAGQFPDGLAYSPEVHKIYVSDEAGWKETVIDTRTNHAVATIDMGGEVGNTKYDSISHLIFANVQTKNELVAIDPQKDQVAGRHFLKGGKGAHGLFIDAPKRLAFAACEEDSKLLVIDLNDYQVTQVFSTGEGPDVLAFDTALERLYVGTESNVVSIFQLHERTLEKLADESIAPNAHTVSVDPKTHLVYLPLKNVGGRPVLRIMRPSAP